MSKKEKLLNKFTISPGPFTWKEVSSVLSYLGFEQLEAEGSRVLFSRDDIDIILHKPHPGNEVKHYAVRQLKAKLLAEELI
jgi:predicted RNA binding protein YcfA (HicA-like mRNA interferase family)